VIHPFHIPEKPAWGVILAITLPALWLGTFELNHLVQVQRARSLPVVEGQIVERKSTERWLGLPLARLTLRETNQGATVFAVLHNHVADKFTGPVRFHYSGNPDEEVFLADGDNPASLVALTFGVPALLWSIFFVLRRSPRYRQMVQ